MRRQIIATLFIGAFAISAVSCGGDSTTTPNDIESGTSEVVLPLTGGWTQASTADAPIAAVLHKALQRHSPGPLYPEKRLRALSLGHYAALQRRSAGHLHPETRLRALSLGHYTAV